jgi:hypothetical protein
MKVGEGAFEITGNRRYFSHSKAERATSATYSRLFKQRPVKMSQKDCDRLREEKELAKCTFSPKIKNLPKNFSNASSDVKNMPFVTQKNSFAGPMKSVLNRSASSMQRSTGLYKQHMEKQYIME